MPPAHAFFVTFSCCHRVPLPDARHAVGRCSAAPIASGPHAVTTLTARGKPAIVAVKQGGTGHAVVVDEVTTRMGKQVMANRDPWGQQYFELLEVFKARFLGQGVVLK